MNSIALPEINLTEPQKLWLKTLYSKIKNGEKINYRILRTELINKVPNDFHPNSIDRNLVESNGEDITLFGVFAIEPESDILEKANIVLNAVKNMLVEKPAINNITSEMIATRSGISEHEVAVILRLISPYGRFWSSAGWNGERFGYTTLTINENDNQIFDEYLFFKDIVDLINKKAELTKHKSDIERQNKIAELLLKELSVNKGTLNTDQQSAIFSEEKGYDWFEFTLVRENLINESLIEWWGDDRYRIRLTPKGKETIEMNLLEDANHSAIKKHEIFVSYSHIDLDKVELIENELKHNSFFSPLIIAFNREATKPLTKKVEEGILRAETIIPILTSKSISTQWLNQEIGFATAYKKRILPIVEKEIMRELKGFIHKEIDLPYLYKSHSDKRIENKEFINQFRILLSDLSNDN